MLNVVSDAVVFLKEECFCFINILYIFRHLFLNNFKKISRHYIYVPPFNVTGRVDKFNRTVIAYFRTQLVDTLQSCVLQNSVSGYFPEFYFKCNNRVKNTYKSHSFTSKVLRYTNLFCCSRRTDKTATVKHFV